MKEKKNIVTRLASSLKGDPIIWIIFILFGMISVVVVYSSTSALAYREETNAFTLFLKQLFFYIVGFCFAILSYRIPLRYYRRYAIPILVISIILLIIPLAVRSLRSFTIFGISIQPSEIAKISIILYLARILEILPLKTFKEYCIAVLGPIGIVSALCLTGSVSATLIILAISAIILITCKKVKRRYLLLSVPIAAGALGLAIILHLIFGIFPRFDTAIKRIERFVVNTENIEETPQERNERLSKEYQSSEAVQAIQLGGLFGRGPGNSIKRDTLPNAYDDYIFSIILEEYGLVGGIIVIFLYLCFFYRSIVIASSCKKDFSTILVLGLSFLITIQAFLHIYVNIGLSIETGQTLPMISRGGTSLVIMSSAFGMILAVNRTIELSMIKKTLEETNRK